MESSSAVCFTPGALALLGGVWLVLQGAITALWWWGNRLQADTIRAKDDSLKDCRDQRDDLQQERNRAVQNLERALQIGETAVGAPRPVRRRP